jgi:hypothetical protein
LSIASGINEAVVELVVAVEVAGAVTAGAVTAGSAELEVTDSGDDDDDDAAVANAAKLKSVMPPLD